MDEFALYKGHRCAIEVICANTQHVHWVGEGPGSPAPLPERYGRLRSLPRRGQVWSRVIKRSRWLLLRNRDNLSDEHAIKLDELLTAGAPLGTAYLLKTQLRGLWYAPDENEATRRWKKYCRTAIESASNR